MLAAESALASTSTSAAAAAVVGTTVEEAGVVSMPAIGDSVDDDTMAAFIARFDGTNVKSTLKGYVRTVREVLRDGEGFGLRRGVALDAEEVYAAVHGSERNKKSGGHYAAGLRKFIAFINAPYSDDQYEIEAITDRRVATSRPGGVSYEVKWKGFSERDWLPEAELSGAKAAIDAFARQREESGRPLTPPSALKPIPVGTQTPPPQTQVRVMFDDGIWKGTVISTNADGSFEVKFASDNSVTRLVPHEHRYDINIADVMGNLPSAEPVTAAMAAVAPGPQTLRPSAKRKAAAEDASTDAAGQRRADARDAPERAEQLSAAAREPVAGEAAASSAEQAGAVSGGAAGSDAELDVGSVVSLKDDPSIHGTVTGKANGYWNVQLADGSGTKKFRLRALQPYGQHAELEQDDEEEESEEQEAGEEQEQHQQEQDLLARPRVRKQTSFLVLEPEQPQPKVHSKRNRKRRAVQTVAAARQPVPTQPVVHKPVAPTKQQAPKVSPETAAGTAGATASIDNWLPPEQVEKLLRKCTSTGKAPKGYRLYSADTTLDLPGAGTVFFQQYRGFGGSRPDDHEWKHSDTNRTMDGAIGTTQVTVRGKQLVKGRQVSHHIDGNFQRRVYTLLNNVTVRLVQYIHTEGVHQPIGPSGSRVKLKQAPPNRAASSSGAAVSGQGSKGSGRAAKRARRNSTEAVAEQPQLQLKEDAIAFSSHVVVTAAALSAQQRGPGQHGKKHWKVLIVGAGAAGLAAAQQLRSEAGLSDDDVLVLEGGDRLGGRIHTQHFPAIAGLRGCRVDLGASYLHGYDFEDYLAQTGQVMNPLQSLAKEHDLKVKVDRHVPQQYSNGWRAHSAWFVNAPDGDDAGRPVVAKKGRESSWNGPDRVFAIDAEIDHLLQKRAQQLNEMEPPLDSNVAEEWESVRDEVLSKPKYAGIDQDKVRKILASMAVVKWGFCGALEERSLCDAFGVTVAKEEEGDEASDGDDDDEEEEEEDDDEVPTSVGRAAADASRPVLEEAGAAKAALALVAETAAEDDPEAPEDQWAGMYDAMMLDGYGEVIEVLSRGVNVATAARVRSITSSSSPSSSSSLSSSSSSSSTTSRSTSDHRGPVEVEVSMQREAEPGAGVGGVAGASAHGGGSADEGQTLTLTADCVIVTVSLGVLQTAPEAGGIRFSPPLPGGKVVADDDAASSSDAAAGHAPHQEQQEEDQEEAGAVRKRDAIDALGFGHENKVVLRFTDRFWRKRGISGGAKHTHWQCLDQRFRFINLDAVGKDGTIVAHVGPPFSVGYTDETGAELTDQQVVAEVCECLRTMFGLADRPVAAQWAVTRWTADELARGSYSFVANGSGSDMCNTLARPEWGGRLCFAGEACCEERVQCVDGALVSGRRAAERAKALLAEQQERRQLPTPP